MIVLSVCRHQHFLSQRHAAQRDSHFELDDSARGDEQLGQFRVGFEVWRWRGPRQLRGAQRCQQRQPDAGLCEPPGPRTRQDVAHPPTRRTVLRVGSPGTHDAGTGARNAGLGHRVRLPDAQHHLCGRALLARDHGAEHSPRMGLLPPSEQLRCAGTQEALSTYDWMPLPR